ncbi:MAG: DUF4258 domain-containing protein [Minisyncoccia bacterium]
MKIILTHHAKHRFLERGVSVSDVKTAIKSPQVHKVDRYGMITAKIAVRNKVLDVIYKIQGSSYIIITAYYEN